MLAAPQAVSGTLVTHIGAPISGRVRLSSNYKAEPGGMYQTSAPFFYTTADTSGDFTFSSVPIGGPYVLEVLLRRQLDDAHQPDHQSARQPGDGDRIARPWI